MRLPQGAAACRQTGAASLPLPPAAPAEEEGGTGKTLYLGLLFGLWYLFNIQFNM